jgi:hypothetical protein
LIKIDTNLKMNLAMTTTSIRNGWEKRGGLVAKEKGTDKTM